MAHFRKTRESIMQVMSEVTQFVDATRSQRYIEEFFSTINDPQAWRTQLLEKPCS